MSEMARYIFLAGAVPFVFLGALHALATPRTIAQSKGLSPRDPALREAMAKATVRITPNTTLWKAWVGFNFSHSLGAVLFGAGILLVGRSQASFESQSQVFLPFAVVVSALYLMIGARYWFRTPIVGIALSTACFLTSAALVFLT
jgi:hypothetical protein